MWPAISKRSCLGFLILVMSIPFELAQHPCFFNFQRSIYKFTRFSFLVPRFVVQKYEEKSKMEIYDTRNTVSLSIINDD